MDSCISRMQNDLHQATAALVQPIEPRRPLLERDRGADQRFDVNRAARHQLEARRVLAAGGARSVEGDLARDDVLERKFYSRRDVAHEDDGPTLAHARDRGGNGLRPARSEEHTSELQSQSNLVCRLLLEKKKNTK